MIIHRISAEVSGVSPEHLEKIVENISKSHNISFSIAEVDPATRCCREAISSNGWRHTGDCKNFVMVY